MAYRRAPVAVTVSLSEDQRAVLSALAFITESPAGDIIRDQLEQKVVEMVELARTDPHVSAALRAAKRSRSTLRVVS